MEVKVSGKVFNKQEINNIIKAAKECHWTSGKWVKKFETGLAKFLDVRFAISCNSGSSANLLAITALDLKPGDEVITTACGFPTTLNPILQNGLVPVFIDIKLHGYNIDVELIEGMISKKTKAIFIAHTLGRPADMYTIMKLAKKYNLWVVEDSCDALGSTPLRGDIATHSFYPAHHITTGEGGAVSTDNPKLAKRIRSLRDWGKDCTCETGQDNRCGMRFKQQHGKLPFGYDHKYVYSTIGYNLKMTDLQAAIGVAQLKKLPKFIQARVNNYTYLRANLKRLYTLPVCESPFGFPIFTPNRNDMVQYLESRGIATRTLFGGNLLKQPAYINIKNRSTDLFFTNAVMNNLFWIGVYPGITKRQLKYMVEVINEYTANRG